VVVLSSLSVAGSAFFPFKALQFSLEANNTYLEWERRFPPVQALPLDLLVRLVLTSPFCPRKHWNSLFLLQFYVSWFCAVLFFL
jgi:hypothetical protein